MSIQSSPNKIINALCRPSLALAWLVVVLACALWITAALMRGYSFDTRILALLPETSHAGQSEVSRELGARADEHLADLASERMIFLIAHPDRQQSAAAAASFTESLGESPLFADVQGHIGQEQRADWESTFSPYRYNLLAPEARRALESEAANADHPLLQQALARLYSPMASAVGPNLVDDPLQLFFTWQLNAAPKTPFTLENGWLTREYEGRVYRLVTLTLAENPYALDYQQQVTDKLADAEAGLPPETQLLSSGLLIHAAHGAERARGEISTIGLGSLLGISLLLIYCFRRLRFLFLAFLPIATGWLFALAVCIAIFDSLHLVTLAFGASLIGVAIDYSLHYLCALCGAAKSLGGNEKRGGDGRATLVKIAPGIVLGLASSVLAYAAQGAAPFPGLRQMALFSVCGLVGACLTVVLWLPYLSTRSGQARAPIHRLAGLLARFLAHWPNIASARVAVPIIAITLLALYQVSQLDFDDDVRNLQTSPEALLQEDARVQSLTRAVNPSPYFILSASSEQALLEVEEKLQDQLAGLLATDQLYDFQAISSWVPSFARQEANRALVGERVFADGGLAALLAEAIGSPELLEQMQARFAENAGRKLTLDQWLASEVGAQQGFLWLGEFDQQFHSLVLVAGVRDQETLQQLAGFASIDQRIHYVDKVAGITAVLEEHRGQLQRWIVFAYGAVLLLLTWRYGRSAWRILAAPAIASLLNLAILSWAGSTLNLFNLLALLLVLGIGLDASIFLWESGGRQSDGPESSQSKNKQAPYTWAAVTLAASTTLLAFGLLSLSATPVLHQFGITVLLGIVAVWCLAPCFTPRATISKNFKNIREAETV